MVLILHSKKSTYEEFKENLKFEEVSGDDVFLLHAVKTKYPNDIHYLKSENAIVKTFAENSFKNFFNNESDGHQRHDRIEISLV
jgi:hypothetical protein